MPNINYWHRTDQLSFAFMLPRITNGFVLQFKTVEHATPVTVCSDCCKDKPEAVSKFCFRLHEGIRLRPFAWRRSNTPFKCDMCGKQGWVAVSGWSQRRRRG